MESKLAGKHKIWKGVILFFLSQKTSNSKDSIIWIGYTYSSMLSSLSYEAPSPADSDS